MYGMEYTSWITYSLLFETLVSSLIVRLCIITRAHSPFHLSPSTLQLAIFASRIEVCHSIIIIRELNLHNQLRPAQEADQTFFLFSELTGLDEDAFPLENLPHQLLPSHNYNPHTATHVN